MTASLQLALWREGGREGVIGAPVLKILIRMEMPMMSQLSWISRARARAGWSAGAQNTGMIQLT